MGGWDALQARLSWLEVVSEGDPWERALDALGGSLAKTLEGIERLSRGASEEELAYFVDDENDLIETLLGTAFVVCQTQITAVVSAAVEFSGCFGTMRNRPCPAFGAEKRDVLALDRKLDGAATVTRVTAIDALANYFKHRDEWTEADWAKLTGRAQRTAEIIAEAGCSAGSTGNLRTGSRALGNADFKSTRHVARIINGWAADVANRTRHAT